MRQTYFDGVSENFPEGREDLPEPGGNCPGVGVNHQDHWQGLANGRGDFPGDREEFPEHRMDDPGPGSDDSGQEVDDPGDWEDSLKDREDRII